MQVVSERQRNPRLSPERKEPGFSLTSSHQEESRRVGAGWIGT